MNGYYLSAGLVPCLDKLGFSLVGLRVHPPPSGTPVTSLTDPLEAVSDGDAAAAWSRCCP